MSLERLLKEARKRYPELGSSSDVGELLEKRGFRPFDHYLGYEIYVRDPDGHNTTFIAARHGRQLALVGNSRVTQIIRADTNDYWRFRLLLDVKGPEDDHYSRKAYFIAGGAVAGMAFTFTVTAPSLVNLANTGRDLPTGALLAVYFGSAIVVGTITAFAGLLAGAVIHDLLYKRSEGEEVPMGYSTGKEVIQKLLVKG